MQLSCQNITPSSGTTNLRFLLPESWAWKTSPDQAMLIQVSPCWSALM